jgi:hypothetical protein
MHHHLMNAGTLKESLGFLGLSIAELAQLLGVSLRSTQRWVYGESDVPNAAQRAIEAWCFLHHLGLPWRPDGYPLLNLEPEFVNGKYRLHTDNTKQLAKLLAKVEARGGPAAPWTVNLSERKATLENMWVSFYPLSDGSFSPQSYGRSDTAVDVARDRVLLEDAFSCIARALFKERTKALEANWTLVEI